MRQVILEVEEQTLDFAEDKLLQAIDAGDANAAKFLLETRGKPPGYRQGDYDIWTVYPRRLTDAESWV